jgi:Chalcone isomerase-like
MKRMFLALGLLAFAAAADAATVAGVNLPENRQVADQSLALSGAALRSKLFFKVYVAGLYLPAKQTDAAGILAKDETRRMEMHFLRSVTAKQICEGWQEGLEANVPTASAELKGQFDQLCGMMQDVRDGSVVTLTYRPEQGTAIEVDGKAAGDIAGKPFADAVLSTWIGPKPGPGEDFKKALLGG